MWIFSEKQSTCQKDPISRRYPSSPRTQQLSELTLDGRAFRDSDCLIASELSPQFESLAFVSRHISLQNTDIEPAFIVPRFASRIWRSFVKLSFHVELQNGLRELTVFAEQKWLAIGDFAI